MEHTEHKCVHLNIDDSEAGFMGICGLASWLADEAKYTTDDICKACNRTTHPRDTNEVVLAMAGIKESKHGPGSTLQKILTWFIAQPKDCNCANRVNVMNAWGPQRCLDELPTILDWLRESALDSGYPYSEFAISAVVKGICYSHLRKDRT